MNSIVSLLVQTNYDRFTSHAGSLMAPACALYHAFGMIGSASFEFEELPA